MAKRRKPLTCKICKKKFYHSAKTHPIGRLNKHLWKEHKTAMKKKHSAGMRKAKRKNAIRPLDREFMAIDDILLAKTFSGEQLPYNAIHEQLGGLILEALIPIVTEGIKYAVARKKAKKK